MGRDADQSRSRRSSKRLRASLDEEGAGGAAGGVKAERASLGAMGEEEGFYPPEDDMYMMDDDGMMLEDADGAPLPPLPEDGEGGMEGLGGSAAKRRPGSSLSLGLGLDSVLEGADDEEGAQAAGAMEEDEDVAPPEPAKKRRKTRKPVRCVLLSCRVCIECRGPAQTRLN